ncbi:MAG: hypothetical protein P8X79_14115 [Reinekea sp.]
MYSKQQPQYFTWQLACLLDDADAFRILDMSCVENQDLEGIEYQLRLRNWQALNGVENLVIAPGYDLKKGTN